MFNQGGDTITTQQTNSLMSFAEPFYRDLMTRAQGVSNQPYTPYQNPRLADFSTDTNRAFQMVRNQVSAGNPAVDSALDRAGGLAQYQAFNGGTLNSTFKSLPENVDAYMSPYIENVLDVQNQRAERRFDEQQVGREADAVAAGAFGGSRRFVQDSLARRDFNEQADLREAQGLEAAYNNAAQMFMSDADRALEAGIASEEARRLGAGLGLEAVRTQGDLAQVRQNLNMNNIEALSNVGSKIQQRGQAGLDLAYQDFLRQQGYPASQLSQYANILYGLPVQPNTTSTETGPAPNFLSQLLGLTLAGTGLVNTYRN